jgi:hypothetical protein
MITSNMMMVLASRNSLKQYLQETERHGVKQDVAILNYVLGQNHESKMASGVFPHSNSRVNQNN